MTEALPRSKHTHLFTLRIPTTVNTPLIIIEAHAGGDSGRHHQKINVEVRQGGKVIFPFGQLHCGVPYHQETTSPYAMALVLELVGMKPGDTDFAYFEGYTPEQLEWASRYGEHLSCVALDRYGGL